ncbi:MAG: integrin alpha [Planctomycetota bacterium]
MSHADSRSLSWAFVATAALCSTTAVSQPFYRAEPQFFLDAGSAHTVSSVSRAGDVNGDGIGDVLVGDYDVNDPYDNDDDGPGTPTVRSGTTGEVLYTFTPDASAGRFGISVHGAGDVNNDGVADFIISDPQDTLHGRNTGSVRVYSGATGDVLYTFHGDARDDRLSSGQIVGDLNGDGFADFILNGGRDAQGRRLVRVMSGATAEVLYSYADLWASTTGVGDVNNDGFDDFAFGESSDGTNGQNAGRVSVVSGATGDVLHEFFGDYAGDNLASGLQAGDVNNDGFNDILTRSPWRDTPAGGRGFVRVHSGVSGDVLHTFWGEDEGAHFGIVAVGIGDVNGDGSDDVAIGDNSYGFTGAVWVYSGADGSLLVRLDGLDDSRFGASVSGIGDINNDGLADFVVSADQPPYDYANGIRGGFATVFLSRMCERADVDCDGKCTPADFNAWVIAFNNQAPACDQNGDGLCDPSDFNAWVLNFNAGC